MNNEIVCHCHRHTVADLEEDVLSFGYSTIMEHIAAASRGETAAAKRKTQRRVDV